MMKKIIAIFLLLISRLGFSAPPDTIQIYAGQGIGNIILLHSSQSEVKNFRHATFSKDKGTSIACGWAAPRKRRWVSYENDSLGLTFNFSARWRFNIFYVFGKMELREIIITKNASTPNGIIIGKATRQDVINAFGEIPDDWKNESYIRYNDKGIAFRFTEALVLDQIEVFIPAK